MNWETIQGKWDEVKGSIRAKWAKLTDDDMSFIGGKYDELVGRLRQRYGYEKDQAQKEVDSFVKGIKTS